jgi:DNA-binding CsgD family transcriptional regulator
MRKPELATIVAEIYDAVCDDGHWSEVVAQSSAALNAAAGAFFLFDKKAGRTPFFYGHNVSEESEREYKETYAPIDERIAFGDRNRHIRVFYDYLHTDEAGIDRSEYYDWIRRSVGCRYYISFVPQNDTTAACCFAMQRTPSAGHAQSAEIELLERLGPHLERALALRKKIDGLTLRASVGAQALDRADYGVIACDGEGRIVHASAAAQKLLAERDGIGDPAGRLDALLPDDRQALRAALASPTGGGPLRIRRDPPKGPLQVTVVPVSSQFRLFGVLQPTRLVLIVDPGAPLSVSHRALRQAFGLTRMEARLAEALLTGQTIAEAARAFGIETSTARVHLHHLLRKTDTARQADLVRLLLRTRTVLMRS